MDEGKPGEHVTPRIVIASIAAIAAILLVIPHT